jgi:hypothetical protein
MSPYAIAMYIGLGGALLFFVLSFVARRTDGYQEPLDPFGSAPLAERELSRHEAEYNRDPKAHMRAIALKFLAVGVLGLVLEIFVG